jgi:hypothetical protein
VVSFLYLFIYLPTYLFRDSSVYLILYPLYLVLGLTISLPKV